MSYTGTGTEADPYIIGNDTTCAEFISLVGGVGYVKMTADIDFSTDDTYKRGTTTRIYLRCSKLYADSVKQDGSRYGINGLKITGISFFYNDSSCTVENIQFVNCIFNKTSSGGLFTTTSYTVFNNCVFSFVMNCYAYDKGVFSTASNQATQFNSCSFYILITGENNALSSICGAALLSYSCIQIDNLVCYGASTMYNWVFSNLTGCTLLCDLTLPDADDSMSANVSGSIGISTIRNSCFAITAHKGAPNQSGYRYINTFDINQNLIYTTTIMDKSIVDTSDGVITLPTETGTFKLLTTQQMKDQSYLLSIGFLP